MSEVTASQTPACAVGDERNGAVSFAGQLDDGEVLTGTPVVADADDTGDLTISNATVNTSEIVVNNRDVAVGEAVQFFVSGMTDTKYTLKITVSTDSSPAQTLVRYVTFKVDR